MVFTTLCNLIAKYKCSRLRIRRIASHTDQYTILHRYAYESDTMCLSQLMMNRRCFIRLCCMLETLGWLKATRYMNVDEQVAIFLHIIAHNRPEPITEDSADQRWKWFKNCLGALHGTHIKCLVPLEDKPRWEGSAADSRVLRNALLRPNGLKIRRPGYYLVDVGYTNGEGFLAPL
uniref:DUF8040 domain-containing protein n=1 Tax=Lactuca sativa TaxID=4236 RepID=A0A9R1W928_LACSA|nr:hypothetical protein LSAT_V11C300120540 [Lactuca sativa]